MNDQSMTPMKVLVTGAGGAAAIAFFKAVRDLTDIEIHMADMDPFATGLYLVDQDHRCLLPPGNSGIFSRELLRYCRTNAISVVVPTVDCELAPLAAHRGLFEAEGTRLVLSPESALKICEDKFNLMENLRGRVDLVEYSLYDESFSPARFGYPFIVKPRTGSGSRGVRLIGSASDLAGVPTDGTYLVQAYLPGTEYSVDVYVSDVGRVVASVIRERIRVDSGITLVGKTLIDDSISAMASTIADLVDIRYVANIQFKLDAKRRPRLLEINPRFPGSMSLTVAAGVNMPEMCLHEQRGDMLGDTYTYEAVAMFRHWQETFTPVSQFLPSSA